MCGLCGVISHSLFSGDIKAFKELLLHSQHRGFDSTGVFSVSDPVKYQDKKKTIIRQPVSVSKAATDATNFILRENKETDKLWDFAKGRILAGHCRAATVGSVTQKNAHPFDFPNLIGMHNGTIRFKSYLKYEKDFETDSEALLKGIAAEGLQDTLNAIGFGGAYALVWFDKVKMTMNFMRNDERPLHFMYGDAQRQLFWASEPWMLKAVQERNHMPESKQGIWSLKPMMHLSIHANSTDNLFTDDNMDITEIKLKPKPYVPPATTYNSRRNALFEWEENAWGGYEYFGVNRAKPSSPAAHDSNFFRNTELIPDLRHQARQACVVPKISKHEDLPLVVEEGNPLTRVGLFGQKISEARYRAILNKGCAVCGDPVDADDEDNEFRVGWSESDLICCPDCIKENDWVDEMLVKNINKPKLNGKTIHVG